MADQAKKPEVAKKPAPKPGAPKPGSSKPSAPMGGSFGSPASKPTNPQAGPK